MNTEFRIKQFEKFYHFLMSNAPEGYEPWFFPCEKNGKNPCPKIISKLAPEKTPCCNSDWVLEEKKIVCSKCKASRGSWHSSYARLSKEKGIELIKQGYNLGISARNEDKLIIGDLDVPELLNQTPKDTLTTISRKRCGCHFFGWDKDGTAKINNPLDDGEMRSCNQYVLAPGSYVPFNLKNPKEVTAFEKLSKEAKEDPLIGFYTIGEAVSPRELIFDDLPEYFRKDYKTDAEVQIENEEAEEKEYKEFTGKGKYSELLKLKMVDIVGAIPHTKRNGHPLHDSDTDANFSLSKDGILAHCWRHLVSLNAVQYLCVLGGYAKCQDAGTPHQIKGKPKRYSKIKGDKKALEFAYNEAVKLNLIKKYSEPTNPVHTELNEIAKLTDSLEIETELKKLKEKYGLSLKILREKVSEKKKDYLDQQKTKTELPCKIDPRFESEELLIHISKELDKDHIEDDREKLGTFIVGTSSKLPNSKDHVSVAHKGNSASGKTNVQMSVVKHFPMEKCGIATRITQSEMEDRIENWDILVVTEINKNREGANTEIVETFKAVMEDGIKIFKKDKITGEPKEINVTQKTGFYATTETETDDELETRYIVIPVRGSENKNRAVVEDTLTKVSNAEYLLKKLGEKESWIAESIRGLNSNLDVVIPFAKEINKKFETEAGEKELFDYSKERVKRDVKRLMSLTKSIAWLYQKRRAIIDDKIIVAEPTDFLTALKIFIPFFNVSYSGLDSRIEEVLEKIKNMEGKHAEEIEHEFGSQTHLKQWVIRTNLQKELGISLNTLKSYISKLKDEGLIQVFWEESHPRFYLIQPVSVPISKLLEPITLQAITGILTGDWQGKDIYEKHGKEQLDTIPLVNSIEYRIKSGKLTGVKLTPSKTENEKDFSEDFE
jgi:hypothetical protein